MVISLLLDEPVSPSLVPRLAELEIDAVSLRDRGRLEATDHDVWALAMAEERTLVSMNGRHFRRLAEVEYRHPGVLILPSGRSRDEQFIQITSATAWIQTKFPMMPTFANYYVEVTERGDLIGTELFANPLLAVQQRLSIH
jgi:predicted nuclease of predicted toxin-antitoxin system